MAGYYGYNCNKTCDSHCRKSVCLQNDGHCECEFGYVNSNSRCEKDAGKQCRKHQGCRNDRCSSTDDEKCIEGCKPGLFGTSCESPCGGNCFCDQVSGKCTDCVTGWFGPECQYQCTCSSGCTEGCYKNGSCIDGSKPESYGEHCNLQCPQHCVSGCDQLSGECVQCEAGRYGPICQSGCSAGCAGCDRNGSCIKGCVKGYYGEKCKSACSSQCVNGLCDLNGACETCKPGFYEPHCINKTEDGTDWMPYILGGGVLLIVVVLTVCMICCLKRMQGIVDNGMKSIGEKSVVNFEPGPSASVCSMNNPRDCGSNYATVESAYDHLFDVKPFSKYSSFDDLETASGYCSVLLQDMVVINDGHGTQSAMSLADVMSDEEGACSSVQKEDGGAQKTCEIIFLQSQEVEEGVLRDEWGNASARNLRDIEVINISKLTNVDETHACIGDWAGGKSGLQFKEDEKCEHYHTHDGEDMDDNKGSKLTDEEETLRITEGHRDQDQVKKISMVCGDLHSRDAEESNGKETREDAADETSA